MANRFEILSEGTVVQSPVGTASSVVTAGPRCVSANDGGVVCTFMSQSKLGTNDFVPTICRAGKDSRSWSAPAPIWPELIGKHSIFCNISRSPRGEMFVFGSRTRIEKPGESFWSEETKGLKANELIWASSADDGRTWTSPCAFALPYTGAAEAPGPLLVTSKGRWIGPYSPYNLMDGSVPVDCGRVIAVISDDLGKNWKPSTVIRFEEPQSVGAEAWVTELSDGRLLSTAWHADMTPAKVAYPNRYAISHDGGETWGKTYSTGIVANTTALTPLSDGRALFINVRRRNDAGIWLSVVKPMEDDFGILADQCIWSATNTTQSGGQATHENWTDFTFGEPAVALLPDGAFFLVFWHLDSVNASVRYLKLKMIG